MAHAPENPTRISGAGGWTPPPVERLQEVLPQYEVLELLGAGGMGAVYKARQKSLKRLVAIKILPTAGTDDEFKFVERFRNEAETLAQMNHPAIVGVYDFGETPNGLLYFVMEFVDGTDVHKMIQTNGKLTTEHALAITAHVCDALAYAHRMGVIHRDIKPANILINREGHVKVADFGLAKMHNPEQARGLTMSNMAMGTPDYAAPEVFKDVATVDHRADLYAVGVMLYQMLTGEVPRGFFKLPSESGADPRFDAIIVKAMEASRDDRYQSALEVRHALDEILTTPLAKDDGTGVISARSLPPRTQATPRPRVSQVASAPAPASSSQAKWLIVAAVIVAVLGVAGFLVLNGKKKPVAKIEIASSERATSPAASAAKDRTIDWLNALPPEASPWSAEWGGFKDGVLTPTSKFSRLLGTMNDGSVRVRVRRAPGSDPSKHPMLAVEIRNGAIPGKATGFGQYQFQVLVPKRTCSFSFEEKEKAGTQGKLEYLWRGDSSAVDDPGSEGIEWEFRVVGDEFSAWADGKLIQSVRDARVPSGLCTITANPGMQITRLETTGLIPTKPSPAKTATTDGQKTDSVSPPKITAWRDVTDEAREKAKTTPGLIADEQGIRKAGPGTNPRLVLTPPGQRDQAVFVRYTGEAQVDLHYDTGGFFYVLAQGHQMVIQSQASGKEPPVKLAPDKHHPADFDTARPHELLVTIEGSRLRTWLDGRFVAEAKADTFTEGATALTFLQRTVVHKVELAELASAASDAWQPIFMKREDFGGDLRDVEFRDGATFLKSRSRLAPATSSSGAIRATLRSFESDRTGSLTIRSTEKVPYGEEDFACIAFISGSGGVVMKVRDRTTGSPELKRHDFTLAPALKPEETFVFELRATDGKITVSVNGREVGSVPDTWKGGARRFGITPSTTEFSEFRDVAVRVDR